MDIEKIMEMSLFGISIHAVLRFCIKAAIIYPVSYTHLTLPTNSRV